MQFVHAVRHDTQRVDVQARVGFVENGELRASRAICRISLRFFSPRKTGVDAALEEGGSISSSFIFSCKIVELQRIEFFGSAGTLLRCCKPDAETNHWSRPEFRSDTGSQETLRRGPILGVTSRRFFLQTALLHP
jgi:hypothetical protein